MNTNSGNRINQLLNKFESISLAQMDEVNFLKRKDTKYVFHRNRLEALLKEINSLFRLLIVNNLGIQEYKTVYFDTPSLEMYHQHHNGLRDRFKIRARQYINSNLFFLEVKVKNNKNITSKKRIKMDDLNLEGMVKDIDFIADKSPFTESNLHKTIANKFSRITLINEKTPERITIDLDLSYINPINGKELEMPNVCILEIKRSSNAKNEKLDKVLKKLQIFPMNFSKYCIGISQLEPTIKSNHFKPWIHQLKKEEIIH